MLFGRKRRNDAAAEDAKALVRAIIDHHVDTERMKEAARSSDRTVAVLRPQIPLRGDYSAGWFGGHAALPDGFEWPEQDGQKMLFVGQINLAALPRDLWSGVGPRSGWIALFIPGQGDFKPTVIGFDGPLTDTKGPPPNSAAWARNHNFEEPRTFVLPRWPIEVAAMPGPELQALASSAAPSQAVAGPPLLDPAYQPFNTATLRMLLKKMGETVFFMSKQIIRFPSLKKLRPEHATWFARQRIKTLETYARFFEIEGRAYAKSDFDSSEIVAFVDSLATLEACDYDNLETDDEGFCVLDLRDMKLIDRPNRPMSLVEWWPRYEWSLRNHAMAAYTSEPTTLPSALRARLESEWSQQSHQGLAAMGHAPSGHIYTPHGPDTANEVLLELHTSKITGWIWGDCYSLVLLIERGALSRGDFSAVTFDITN